MNRRTTDVLVIGAGPAGSAAARMLAAAGARVCLADRYEFPRDKVCGDALLPDALQTFSELGLRHRVLCAAQRVREVRLFAPNHTVVTVEGECACLPRAVLDDLLRESAIESGAEFSAPLRALAPIEADGVVRGAYLEDVRTGAPVEVRAGMTILATGATANVLQRFGMCQRTAPSATAARIYVRARPDVAKHMNHLCISYPAAICPGYGWIFPGPDHTFNVGVGYFYDARALPAERNVRHLLRDFVNSFPPAAALMKGAQVLTKLKGAPLRTAMRGARLARPGLLVAGEAAGLTYSFSGEGIGKALQSGIIAARIAAGVVDGSRACLQRAADAYEQTVISSFAERFNAYVTLQKWVSYPLVSNLLARRANKGRYVRRQLEAFLNETGRATELISMTGVVRALLT